MPSTGQYMKYVLVGGVIGAIATPAVIPIRVVVKILDEIADIINDP